MPGKYTLYRFTNKDGSSKDWAVRSNGDGTYTSRWGKTGARLQSKTFQKMTPMNDHIREKTNKGYKLIGNIFIDHNGKAGDISLASLGPVGEDPHPTQESLCIYWRIKMLPAILNSPAVPFLKGFACGCAQSLLRVFPDSSWLGNVKSGHGDFVKPQAGQLLPEHGAGPLLLLMALKKNAADGITISLSHEDGVEISDQLKMESQALSFFDTDLESVRSVAEEIGLLDKRLDLSLVVTELEDFYF